MRTRNADSSKAPAARRAPSTRKSASKSPATPQSTPPQRTSTIRTRQSKKNEASPVENASFDDKPEQSSEEAKAATGSSQVTSDAKVATPAKSTPKRGRPRKAVSTRKQGEQLEAIADETAIVENVIVAEKLEEPQNLEIVKTNEREIEQVGQQGGFVGQSAGNEQQPMEGYEPVLESACESVEKERDMMEVEVSTSQDVTISFNQEEPTILELTNSLVNGDSTGPVQGEQEKEENGEKASEKSIEEETKGKEEHGEKASEKSIEEETKGKEEHGEKASEKSIEEETKGKEEHGEKASEISIEEETEGKEELGEKASEKSIEEETEGKEEHVEKASEKSIEEETERKEEHGEKASEKSIEEEIEGKEEHGEKASEKSIEEETEEKEEHGEKAPENPIKEETEEREEHGEKASEKSIEEEKDGIERKEQSITDAVSMEMKDQGEQGREENGDKVLEKSIVDGEKASEISMDVDGEKPLEKSEVESDNVIHNKESYDDSVGKQMKHQSQEDDVKPEKENLAGNQGNQVCSEKLDLGEQGEEEFGEDDPKEHHEETETLEEDHREWTAIAKERTIKKEHEIFVGGLDRDATEEDLKKVFEKIGEVVEVRLHKNSSTNKNKGYAFVKFSCKEHAKKALSEMKNPIICGKRCGTAPSEDNDTLFLGNICNTWTKEAIKQKLKDYGIEGVENITLVPDVLHVGLSRGFAFLEFSCHADAMLAYKRLQKPDVIFGHAERTAKVAFAEPVREPDPAIMAQVKSVFVDGLPPHWDEACIREHFKGYGEIVRVVLARNMSTAKRKDFGFVDFSTHEAAVACVDGVNSSEFVDGTSKTKVRVRLSNPLPKTQAVKGGMCGGFRIGQARTETHPRSGRGIARGGQAFNRGNFSRDRSFFHGGRGQMGRMGFRNDLDVNNTYPDFHQRQFGFRGERMGPLRGGHFAGGQAAAMAAGPSGPYVDRPWFGAPERGPGEPMPPRMPFSPEGQFDRPFMGRHFDDPYRFDENVHGVKRPFHMTDPDPNYMGPVRFRPRLDYTDPAVFQASRYHDSAGAGSGQYSRDYYGPDYGRGPHTSFYGGNNSYGRGYHY